MITESCPKCSLHLEAGFPFCDQCGIRLGECPTCRKAGFRKHCPADGSALVFRTAEQAAPACESRFTSEPVATVRRMSLHQVDGSIRLDLQREETIGRKEGAFKDLLSPYTQVSRAHARIWRESTGEWRIEDLGSRNKTYVNEVELAPKAPVALRVGNVVRFADVAFRVNTA